MTIETAFYVIFAITLAILVCGVVLLKKAFGKDENGNPSTNILFIAIGCVLVAIAIDAAFAWFNIYVDAMMVEIENVLFSALN